jgi:hypothetical protein
MPIRGGRRRTRVSEAVRTAIQAAALLPVPPAATVLSKQLDQQYPNEAPSLRTVQLLLSRYIPPDKGDWWRFGDGDPADDAIVISVVGELYRHPPTGEGDTGGLLARLKGTIHRSTARWIVHVHAAAPDIAAGTCYEFARRFDACEQAGTDNTLLALALALGVWRSSEEEDAALKANLLPEDWARIDRKEAFR